MIDTKRLAEWMDERGLPGKGAPLEATYLSGGTQNEIYKLVRDDFTSVIRIPPAAAPADRDSGIMREWRIIQGLDGTDVPHTAAIAACEDTSVLGRAFYLMGFVDGWSPMDHRDGWPAPFDNDPKARAGLAYQLAEGIGLLSKVDWKAQGLEGLGRPDGFHDRQVDRWTRFFERIKAREIEGMDIATKWLQNHRPLDYIPGLMHGDYQFANVMYEHGGPAKLAALVDWEMGTVGDPKLDLGWMLMNWPEDMDAPGESAVSYVDLSGMPNRSQMLAHYSEVSGRQVDDIDYYLILAKWKLAIVLEQGFQRAGDDVKLQSYGPVITDLMKSAAELAESTGYKG
ncbi:aminoglycoside phosphotransferase (APT) family kinase protein [Rhodococcus sp. SMB37]|nr:aminoglycoside phosphotransferase (APT) family kinase protein [Rhodococcus sp. SMB37]